MTNTMQASGLRDSKSISTKTISAISVAAMAWMLASPGTAAAQAAGQAQPAPEAAPADAYGNEIVVTATKREQTLQDVPVAVSVTSGETIQRAHILDIKDLTSVVPSLRVNQLQSSANTNFYIRGFGNGANNAGIEPSVGLFIDGVYHSRSASMIADLADVERIEVLRGPQSTLFGKNASAGVISVVTAKPKSTFGGSAEASYGNANAVVLKGLITGPLAQGLAASIGGSFDRRDGFEHDASTGNDTNSRHRWFVRGQLLWEGDSGLSVRLIGDYGRIDENCCAVVNLRPSASTAAIQALGGKVNPASQPFGGVVYNNFDSSNRITNRGLSGQIDYTLGPVKLTSITAWRKTSALTNQDSDFTSADLLQRNYQDLGINTFTQEFRASATILDKVSVLAGAYYFNEKIRQANQVQYGTQFRPYANLLIQGQTGGAQSIPSLEGLFGTLSGNPSLYTGKFFAAGQGLSESYRLKDTSWSAFGQVDFEVTDGLTLTGGVNYTRDRKTFSTNVVSSDVFAGVNLPAMVAGATNAGISQTIGGLLGVPGGFASPAQIAGFAGLQPAAYQQIVAGVNAQTQPLLALKVLQIFPPFLNVPNAVESGRVGNGKFSYTASLAYDVNPSLNLYVRFATGFKAASVNLSRDSRPTPADLTAIVSQGLGVVNLTSGSRYAGPEESTLYEGGIKGHWGTVSANFAIFKQSIKGFQSNIFTGTGFFLANAGKQSAFGIEFEGTARPIPQLTLSAAATYLEPKYDKFLLSAVGDLSGTKPGGVTPFSMTLGAQWEQRLSGNAKVFLRADYHYEAPFKLVEGLPGLVVRNPLTGAVVSYTAALAAADQFKQNINDVNASLTVEMTNGLSMSVWGRNLLNDRTILQIFDSPAQSGSISGYPNQPRTYGVSARFQW